VPDPHYRSTVFIVLERPTVDHAALAAGGRAAAGAPVACQRLEQQLSRDEAVVAGTTYPADLDEAGALDRVRRAARWLLDGRGGRWVIERDGVPQGTAGLVLHDETSVEIFYALLAAHRGRGTATWTARVLAEWASSAGCSRVTLATLVDNAASQRTAERAGFVRSGQVQRLHKGTSADFVEWSYVPASV
jgi:RimJ/RimL family protein N-acetyltransferase